MSHLTYPLTLDSFVELRLIALSCHRVFNVTFNLSGVGRFSNCHQEMKNEMSCIQLLAEPGPWGEIIFIHFHRPKGHLNSHTSEWYHRHPKDVQQVLRPDFLRQISANKTHAISHVSLRPMSDHQQTQNFTSCNHATPPMILLQP